MNKIIKVLILVLVYVFVGTFLESVLHVKDPWIYGFVFYEIGYFSHLADSKLDNKKINLEKYQPYEGCTQNQTKGNECVDERMPGEILKTTLKNLAGDN